MKRKEFEAGLERLAPREREVMSLVADARTNPQIAELLGIKRKTVENTIVRANKRFDGQLTREKFIRLWWESRRGRR